MKNCAVEEQPSSESTWYASRPSVLRIIALSLYAEPAVCWIGTTSRASSADSAERAATTASSSVVLGTVIAEVVGGS